MRTLPRAALAVVVTAGVLLASGCGGDLEVTTPEGTVTVDSDGGDFTIEGDDGTTVSGGTSLPDGFPEDEVPLVEGTVLQAVEVAGEQGGFSVSLTAPGEVDAVLADAVARLEAAGFERRSTQDLGGIASALLGSTSWEVLVSATASGEDGAVQVGYTVGPATP